MPNGRSLTLLEVAAVPEILVIDVVPRLRATSGFRLTSSRCLLCVRLVANLVQPSFTFFSELLFLLVRHLMQSCHGLLHTRSDRLVEQWTSGSIT